jgi:hypothetical protein
MKPWMESLLNYIFILAWIVVGSRIFVWVMIKSLDNYLYKKFKSYTKSKKDGNKEKTE